jgi:hypothetical protein
MLILRKYFFYPICFNPKELITFEPNKFMRNMKKLLPENGESVLSDVTHTVKFGLIA